MKKRCTNSACRRVFSTTGGCRECPHCGKEYRMNQITGDFSRHMRTAERERGFGRLECVRRGGVQHMWIGPALTAKDARPNRSSCSCMLMLAKAPDRENRLRRLQVLRGDDGFLRLRDAKAAVEALMEAPVVLHTDPVTACAIVDSRLFSIRRVPRVR